MEILPSKKQFARLKLVIKTIYGSRRSSFYNKKYQQNKFLPSRDLKHPADIKKIPTLAREELVKTSPDKRLYVPKNRISGFKYTSGTTGGINIMYRSWRDLDVRVKNRRAPYTTSLYLRRTESVPKLYEEALLKGRLPIFADYNNLTLAVDIASRIKIEELVANPAKAIEFGERLKAVYDISRIESVRLSTKRTTFLQQKILKKIYPKARFYSIYSMVESDGYIGKQCPSLSKKDLNLYHLHPRFFGEINYIDGCKKNEGELILTHLQIAPTPLVRYCTGDLVEWIGDSSFCLCREPVFRFLGRAKFDAIRLTANNLTLRAVDIERVLRGFYNNSKILDFQAHIFEKKLGYKVAPNIVLELLQSERTNAGAISKISHSFKSRFRFWYSYVRPSQEKTIDGVLKQKTLSGFRIKFVKKFSGPEKRFIVDHR